MNGKLFKFLFFAPLCREKNSLYNTLTKIYHRESKLFLLIIFLMLNSIQNSNKSILSKYNDSNSDLFPVNPWVILHTSILLKSKNFVNYGQFIKLFRLDIYWYINLAENQYRIMLTWEISPGCIFNITKYFLLLSLV